ncbi:hypothetical protein GCM10027268_22830 [Brachybacterium huguangmaarense]
MPEGCCGSVPSEPTTGTDGSSVAATVGMADAVTDGSFELVGVAGGRTEHRGRVPAVQALTRLLSRRFDPRM